MRNKTNRYKSGILILIVFLILSCAPLGETSLGPKNISETPLEMTEQSSPVPQESPNGQVTAIPTSKSEPIMVIDYGQPFADYTMPEITIPDTFSGGYTLPLNLDQVRGLDKVTLSNPQKTLLAQNGFVVEAPNSEAAYLEFYQIYESYRYEDQPLFATTDAVFHVYHLLFDKILRDLETTTFIPTLEELTSSMLEASQSQYEQLTGTPLEEPARRNLAFFTVAGQLLELQDESPASVSDLVEAELALINAHDTATESPIWFREDLPADKRLIEDYSQYVPRGHYTRSDAMKRYFKTMMWYGRLTFRLRDPFETQRALLITHALASSTTASGESASTAWANVFDPVGFLVGKADDPGFYEYQAISDNVFGESPDLTAFADPGMLEDFMIQARSLPAPQVNSMWVWIWEDVDEATQGFRFMGQRFTLDAYLFGELMWRNVGTQDNPRGLPKGLDILSAMGSDEAYTLLDEMGETSYKNYSEQMEKVRNEVAALGLDSWTQNLYWSWLYAFQPVIEVKDASYPDFMQSEAWTHKDLQTALGSWTELKHDTILYAKQVMAEMGGGGPDETIRGYVEPNPMAFARLYALAKMTHDGLDARGILDVNSAGNLLNLMDLLEFLTNCAVKELNGETLSDEDYWRLQFFGGELEMLTIAAADAPDEGGRTILQDQRSALIADVATGFGAALEEAVGNPTRIYVVLPDEPWRVAVGAVYTYYEFNVSADQRMTNEQWYEQLDSGNAPPQPSWSSSFIAP